MSASCYSRAKQLANDTKITHYIVSPVSGSKTLIILTAFGDSMKKTFKLLATVNPDGFGGDTICASTDVHALMTGPGLEAQQFPKS